MTMVTNNAARAPTRPPVAPPRRSVADVLRRRCSIRRIASDKSAPRPAAVQRCSPNGERLRVMLQAAAIRKMRKSQAFHESSAAEDFDTSARFREGSPGSSDGGDAGRVRLIRPLSAGVECNSFASGLSVQILKPFNHRAFYSGPEPPASQAGRLGD